MPEPNWRKDQYRRTSPRRPPKCGCDLLRTNEGATQGQMARRLRLASERIPCQGTSRKQTRAVREQSSEVNLGNKAVPRGNGDVSSPPASRVELGQGHKTVRTSKRLASVGALGIHQSSTGSFPTANVQDREQHACQRDPELDPERTCGCGDAKGGAQPSSAARRRYLWGAIAGRTMSSRARVLAGRVLPGPCVVAGVCSLCASVRMLQWSGGESTIGSATPFAGCGPECLRVRTPYSNRGDKRKSDRRARVDEIAWVCPSARAPVLVLQCSCPSAF